MKSHISLLIVIIAILFLIASPEKPQAAAPVAPPAVVPNTGIAPLPTDYQAAPSLLPTTLEGANLGTPAPLPRDHPVAPGMITNVATYSPPTRRTLLPNARYSSSSGVCAGGSCSPARRFGRRR